MRLDSPAYIGANFSPNKRPRYAISIEFADNDFEWFVSHPDIIDAPAGAIVSSVVDYSTVSEAFDAETGSTSIGSFSVDLLDQLSQLTQLFSTRLDAGFGLRGKRLRFYKGFAPISFNDYALRATQVINSEKGDAGMRTIRCQDLKRNLREYVFEQAETSLAQTLSATETNTITVDDTSAFALIPHGPSYTHGPNGDWGYVQIDDEIIGFQGITPTTFTGLERGLFNTPIQAHEVTPSDPAERREKVTEFIYLELPGPKLALAVMTGELYGQSDGQGGWLTLPDSYNLGIDPALVDYDSFLNIGTDLWDPMNDGLGKILRFAGLERQTGKRFLESEVFQLLQFFARILGDGRLSATRVTPVLSGATEVITLTEDNVHSVGPLEQMMDLVINRVRIQWARVAGEFRRQNILIDEESRAIHSEARTRDYKYAGLASNRETASTLNSRFDAIRDRYAQPPLRIQINVLRSLDRLTVGDIVRLQLQRVRDLTGNVVAIDRAFEVRRISENRQGPIQLQLEGSSAPAGSIDRSGNAFVLPDAYYGQTGTDIASITTLTAGATPAGTITLNGAADARNAVYYFLGDLTISAGTVLQISQNVTLAVRGTLTINGRIDGVGRGIPGVGSAGAGINGAEGTAGYFGNTHAGPGLLVEDATDPLDPPLQTLQALNSYTLGQVGSLPEYELSVEGLTIQGLPADLRGTSGGVGAPIANESVTTTVGAGGGDGGAGLTIISRQLAFGINGEIDLSGEDGDAPNIGPLFLAFTGYSGGGAGGMPGGLLVLLDGPALLPNALPRFTANGGLTPYLGDSIGFGAPRVRSVATPAAGNIDVSRLISGRDYAEAALRVQYIPEPIDPVEELPDVENDTETTVVRLTNEAHTVQAAADGSVSSFAGADGRLQIFQGTSDITQLVSISVESEQGCDITLNTADNTPINGQPKGYYRTDSMTANQAQAVMRAVVDTVSYDVTFSLAKSLAGADGSSGTTARIMRLDADGEGFKFDGDGNLVSAATINLTATRQNISSATSWSTVPAGLLTNVSGDTAQLASASFGALESVRVRVESESFSDTQTLYRFQDGAQGDPGDPGSPGAPGNPGAPGAPGYTITPPFASISISTNSSGVPNSGAFNEATGPFVVLAGDVDVTDQCTFSVSNSGVVAAVDGNGVLTITALNADQGRITVTIQRSGVTIGRPQITVTKSRDGSGQVTGSTTAISNVNSTSFSVISSVIQDIGVGPGGTITAQFAASYVPLVGGPTTVTARVMYRDQDVGGAWIQLGSTQVGGPSLSSFEPGGISLSESISGPAQSEVYEFRLEARYSGSSGAAVEVGAVFSVESNS